MASKTSIVFLSSLFSISLVFFIWKYSIYCETSNPAASTVNKNSLMLPSFHESLSGQGLSRILYLETILITNSFIRDLISNLSSTSAPVHICSNVLNIDVDASIILGLVSFGSDSISPITISKKPKSLQYFSIAERNIPSTTQLFPNLICNSNRNASACLESVLSNLSNQRFKKCFVSLPSV